jgi:hypothetical protein
MKKVLFVGVTVVVLALPAASAAANEPKPKPAIQNFDIKRSLFSGNESSLDPIGGVRSDCTVPIADVRIVRAPAHGKVRFEESKTVITNRRNPIYKLCFGKKADAVMPFYEADEKFVGEDRLVIEFDTKLGAVRRYSYVLDVTRKTGTSKKTGSTAEVVRPLPALTLSRDVFSGNEVRLAAMNWVNADCTSGPAPDLRIVTAPQNGELRQEEITMPIDRRKGDSRFECNGKPVTAVAVHYKPKAEFTGKDNVVIDVDYKTGAVKRFNYNIGVR